jgi:hypothetical protein
VQTTSAEATRSSEIAAMQTFAFARSEIPRPRVDAYLRSPAGEEARRRIARELERRGYAPARAGERPDFLIAIDQVERRFPVVENWGEAGPYEGWVYRWGGAESSSGYVEETIEVTLLDARSGRVLWRGQAARVIDGIAHDDVRAVGRAIDAVMSRAPTRVAGARRPPL